MNSEKVTQKAAQAVDQDRLWGRIQAMGALGATPKGGVNRQAFSQEDRQARRLLAEWANALGLAVAQDAIGNLFVRLDGADKGAKAVLTGSHLDSQPTGGKFDGAYGVMAGFEALEAMVVSGLRPRRPIELVAWANEEGSRFQPGAMGSAVYAGAVTLDRLAGVTGFDGAPLAGELAATLADAADIPLRAAPDYPEFYVEAHIEQGPRLEHAGLPIGVVTGIQGQHRYRITLTGEEAHAGTTPHALRADALQSAVAIINALNAFMQDPEDIVRFTIGRFEVAPGSPNTVPGQVVFTIDLRHPDATTLTRLGSGIEGIAKAEAGRCGVSVEQVSEVAPVHFDTRVIAAVREEADALGLANMEMISGAGHDAMHVAAKAPAGMIFIPCLKGISHNEAEWASPEQCAAGARVLAATLLRLANS